MKNSLLLLIYFASIHLYAQDKIHKKDKSIIACKVREIGTEEIRYTESAASDDLIISIRIEEVLKVVLENGRTIEFSDPLQDIGFYTENRKKAIKLHFLSPLLENLAFSFEWVKEPGRSFESTLGFIGLGFDTQPEDRNTGVHLGFGYKFMRTPDFYSSRLKYAHIMKGGYVKPQVLFSAYRNVYDYGYYYGPPWHEEVERDIVAVALLLNIGKQVVFDNIFLIDYSLGLGYGWTNQDNTWQDDGSSDRYRLDHFGFLVMGEQVPFSVSFNFKIGLLIGRIQQ